MLPVLLVLSLLAILLGGATVIWLIVANVVSPLTATIGSLVVIAACVVALALLFARQRVRRLQRELRTIRRSQAVREREPVTYGEDDEEDAVLVHSLGQPEVPGERPGAAGLAETGGDLDDAVLRACAEDGLAVFLEPLVAMPANEVVAYRARAGLAPSHAPEGVNADSPLDAGMLGAGARAALDLALLRAAIPIAERALDGLPVHVEASAALLESRDQLRQAVRLVEGTEATIGFRVATRTLDALSGGRLEDLTDAEAPLVETGLVPGDIDRPEASELSYRGIAFFAFPADGPAEDPRAGRGLRHLAEAGIVAVAEGLADERTLIDCADLGIAHFAGPLLGDPRRVRDDVVPDEARQREEAVEGHRQRIDSTPTLDDSHDAVGGDEAEGADQATGDERVD